jgi:hypothetical protein
MKKESDEVEKYEGYKFASKFLDEASVQ